MENDILWPQRRPVSDLVSPSYCWVRGFSMHQHPWGLNVWSPSTALALTQLEWLSKKRKGRAEINRKPLSQPTKWRQMIRHCLRPSWQSHREAVTVAHLSPAKPWYAICFCSIVHPNCSFVLAGEHPTAQTAEAMLLTLLIQDPV